jgi:hypothetical protein
MSVSHVFEEASHSIRTILTLNIFAENIDMSASFTDEGVSSAL